MNNSGVIAFCARQRRNLAKKTSGRLDLSKSVLSSEIPDSIQPMRILRIINRFNLGGPTYNAGYLTRYIGDDCETRLIGGSPLPEEAHSGFILDSLDVAYEEIHEMSRAVNPFQDLKALFKIRRIIREFKPDIVHTHAAKAGLLGRIAARLEGIPVIVHTYHGHVFSGYFGKLKSTLVKAMERWLAARSDAIIVISPSQFNDIVKTHKICAPNKAHIIPLGFDLNRFTQEQENKRTIFREKYGIPKDALSIGIVGRFAPVKNHRLFFESMQLLRSRGYDFKAVVIGDGDDGPLWKSWVKEHYGGREDDFIFTSWVREMDVAMAGLDIVMLTSLNEGTPVSLIEAQAAGKPVVTTPAGGVRDCILESKTGFVSQSFEASEILGLLEQLITSQEMRTTMGESGRAYVMEKFSHKRLIADMRTLYNSLVRHNKQHN